MHDSGEAVSQITLAELGVIYESIPQDDDGKWEKSLGAFSRLIVLSVAERP